jgi:hypothetical protein
VGGGGGGKGQIWREGGHKSQAEMRGGCQCSRSFDIAVQVCLCCGRGGAALVRDGVSMKGAEGEAGLERAVTQLCSRPSDIAVQVCVVCCVLWEGGGLGGGGGTLMREGVIEKGAEGREGLRRPSHSCAAGPFNIAGPGPVQVWAELGARHGGVGR